MQEIAYGPESTFPSHNGFPIVWKGSIPVLIEFGRKIAEYDEKPSETASNGDHLIMWLSRGSVYMVALRDRWGTGDSINFRFSGD